MNLPQLYVAIAIVVLAIVAIIVLRKNKNRPPEKLSVWSGLAFGFIFAGIIFGEIKTVGYSLMAVGGALAIVDIIKKLKNK